MTITRSPGRSGYWMLARDGTVYPFGAAARSAQPPIVSVAVLDES